jgi:fatty-acyl-CoA synthase
MNELVFKPGTIWHRWCENAAKEPGATAIVFWKAGEVPYRWTRSELMRVAKEHASALISRGVQRGDVCAIIARHNRLLYPIYLGCVYAGAVPAILAYQNPRLHPEKFREGLEGMGKCSGLDWILTETSLSEVLQPLLERSTIKGLLFPFDDGASEQECAGERPAVTGGAVCDSDPLLLQHSSGTTGLQKPVLLSHHAVLDHVTQYARYLEVSESDVVASWLPLYHDMGLIAAFHLPLAVGIPAVQIDPFEWVVAPSLLLDVISSERATMAWLPNFAFSMMADKIRAEDLEGVHLDSWRMAINCSEPVRFRDQEKFFRRFAPFGLQRESLSSCYAMAEATFAVTQTPPGKEPAMLEVDAEAFSQGLVRSAINPAAVKRCVSSGTLIPGCRIRIVDEELNDLAEERVGEVLIKTPWMFDGYRNYPEKTAAALREGWYLSGDYGFRSGEEVYIVGRKKDLIIVAGNNIYPEDVEAAVSDVSGVIPGRVIAFGEEDPEFGSERVSVIAETALTDEVDRQRLKMNILQAGKAVNVTITSVYLVPPRFLVKSSAGKPSRSANRERIERLRASQSTQLGVKDDFRGNESSDPGSAKARSLGT